MKYHMTATISTVALVLALGAPSRAACPPGFKEYDGPDGGDWRKPTNWDDDSAPISTDDVCIPPNTLVMIWAGKCTTGANIGDPCDPVAPGPECAGGTCTDQSYSAAACAKLQVEPGTELDDGLMLTASTRLDVHGVATIDGFVYVKRATLDLKSTADIEDDGSLQVMASATLHLRDDVTIASGGEMGVWANEGVIQLEASIEIKGNGGEIMTDIPYDPIAEFKSGTGTGSPYTLTLDGVNNAAAATSLTLRGEWDINVPVVNNAFVLADDSTLAFHTSPVEGTGMWEADKVSTTPGNLIMNVAATGTAEWCLDDDATAKITFNANSTAMTSDFNLEKGTLVINADVSTTGDLNMVSVGTNTPKITVASGDSVVFGG